jgi:predicted ABC-type ATPase
MIFAGPNGSGKSTVIRAIVEEENLQNPNFHLGYYINADDIAIDFTLNKFRVKRGLIVLDLDSIQTFRINQFW